MNVWLDLLGALVVGVPLYLFGLRILEKRARARLIVCAVAAGLTAALLTDAAGRLGLLPELLSPQPVAVSGELP